MLELGTIWVLVNTFKSNNINFVKMCAKLYYRPIFFVMAFTYKFVPWADHGKPFFKGTVSDIYFRYSTGFPVEYITGSYMIPIGQKYHRNDLLSEKEKIGRSENSESTSQANYEECASHPYVSYRNLQTSMGLGVAMVVQVGYTMPTSWCIMNILSNNH